jgi:hypothetical protein
MKQELEELDRKNKKLAKKMMKISIKYSSLLIFIEEKKKGLEIRIL